MKDPDRVVDLPLMEERGRCSVEELMINDILMMEQQWK